LPGGRPSSWVLQRRSASCRRAISRSTRHPWKLAAPDSCWEPPELSGRRRSRALSITPGIASSPTTSPRATCGATRRCSRSGAVAGPAGRFRSCRLQRQRCGVRDRVPGRSERRRRMMARNGTGRASPRLDGSIERGRLRQCGQLQLQRRRDLRGAGR